MAGQGGVELSEKLSAILNTWLSNQASNQVSNQVVKEMIRLTMYTLTGTFKRSELLEHIGLSKQTKNVKKYIEPLESIGWLAKTVPDKPNSPRQRYTATDTLKQLIAQLKKESVL